MVCALPLESAGQTGCDKILGVLEIHTSGGLLIKVHRVTLSESVS